MGKIIKIPLQPASCQNLTLTVLNLRTESVKHKRFIIITIFYSTDNKFIIF